jgi:hypothetical protein
MRAFHNDPAIKEKYLARVREHRRLDEIAKGYYYEKDDRGKGMMCAVGCTVHSNSHKAYEEELGIPEWVAHVEDVIFERLPNKKAKFWPEDFLSAIPVGSDLDKIKVPFVLFCLRSTLDKFDHNRFPSLKKFVDTVVELYEANETDVGKFEGKVDEADDLRRTLVCGDPDSVGSVLETARREASVGSVLETARRAAMVTAGGDEDNGSGSAGCMVAEVAWMLSDQYQIFVGELLRLIKAL